MSNLKIGLLLEPKNVDFYTYKLTKEILVNGHTPIILHGYEESKHTNSPFFQRLINLFRKKGLKGVFHISKLGLNIFLYKIILSLELRIVKKEFPNYNQAFSIEKLHLREIKINGIWSKNGTSFLLDKKSISIVKSEKFDILIRLGNGIIKGELLDASRHGVLSFHHGDNRFFRGSLAGFWEVLANHPSVGFIIQRLSQDLDGGDVLYRHSLMTRELWHLNCALLQEKSIHFMINLIIYLDKTGELPSPQEVSFCNSSPKKIIGRVSPYLNYIIKIYFPLFIKKIKRIFFGDSITRWGIKFIYDQSLNFDISKSIEIKNLPNRFFADPFVIKHKNRNICFVEDYFIKQKKGKISAIELFQDGYKFLGNVLDEEFHLSYPYVFEHKKDIFMIPESSQNNDIRLYKAVDFPLKWKLDTVLMNDISAADISVFNKDGIWFMFLNVCSSGIGEHNSELHIFTSEKLRSSKWTPISEPWPVISDAQKSRNGGMFEFQNKLYRISQKHTKNHYGNGFCFNEVKELEMNNYVEKSLYCVEPNLQKNEISCHHFHRNEDFCVTDFAKRQSLRRV